MSVINGGASPANEAGENAMDDTNIIAAAVAHASLRGFLSMLSRFLFPPLYGSLNSEFTGQCIGGAGWYMTGILISPKVQLYCASHTLTSFYLTFDSLNSTEYPPLSTRKTTRFAQNIY